MILQLDCFSYIIDGLIGFILLQFILITVVLIRQSKLNKRYKAFMNGSSGKSIENMIIEKFDRLNVIENALKDINVHLNEMEENLLLTYKKNAIVKYDALKEMGGKLSFVLTMLNSKNTGFIINSMNCSREGSYVYIKEVFEGEVNVTLSDAEKQSLEEAIRS